MVKNQQEIEPVAATVVVIVVLLLWLLRLGLLWAVALIWLKAVALVTLVIGGTITGHGTWSTSSSPPRLTVLVVRPGSTSTATTRGLVRSLLEQRVVVCGDHVGSEGLKCWGRVPRGEESRVVKWSWLVGHRLIRNKEDNSEKWCLAINLHWDAKRMYVATEPVGKLTCTSTSDRAKLRTISSNLLILACHVKMSFCENNYW